MAQRLFPGEVWRFKEGQKLLFVVAATMKLLFFEIYKKVFNMHGAWYIQYTLPTMVQGQDFCITS